MTHPSGPPDPDEPGAASGPDPAADPDRFRPGDGAVDGGGGGDGGRTLTEMLGDGAYEEPRDTYTWLVGLLAVLAFLGLVALAARHLGP